MRRQVLLDTGPLVAFLDHRDMFHEWAKRELSTIAPPLLTCEAVLTEACFLLGKIHRGQETVMALVQSDRLKISFVLSDEAVSVGNLLMRYQSVPMSLADACIVKMAEQNPQSMVLTLDSDFRIYRRNKNQTIPIIMPES